MHLLFPAIYSYKYPWFIYVEATYISLMFTKLFKVAACSLIFSLRYNDRFALRGEKPILPGNCMLISWPGERTQISDSHGGIIRYSPAWTIDAWKTRVKNYYELKNADRDPSVWYYDSKVEVNGSFRKCLWFCPLTILFLFNL